MHKQLRLADLIALGVVGNRATLGNWIKHRGFPRGRLIGPNTRAWDEGEVQDWLASRPDTPKATPRPKRRPGRPRKNASPENHTGA
jgi:predicted DNA-binding transcriptional regulator AlpA